MELATPRQRRPGSASADLPSPEEDNELLDEQEQQALVEQIKASAVS